MQYLLTIYNLMKKLYLLDIRIKMDSKNTKKYNKEKDKINIQIES